MENVSEKSNEPRILRPKEKKCSHEIDRRIVCAANKLNDGTFVLGVRNYDMIMRATLQRLKKSEPNLHYVIGGQGFVDNEGRWVNRKQAWKIAEAAGQIIRRVGGDTIDGGTLFSENLY